MLKPAENLGIQREAMKRRIVSVAIGLALVFNLSAAAFADNEDATILREERAHEIVEEVSDIIDEISESIKEDIELPPRELERDKHAAEAETATEPQNVSDQENSTVSADSIGRSGAYKTLVVAIALLGLGGGVIVLANQKARESKKPSRKV